MVYPHVYYAGLHPMTLHRRAYCLRYHLLTPQPDPIPAAHRENKRWELDYPPCRAIARKPQLARSQREASHS